jgi:hypothetical protein
MRAEGLYFHPLRRKTPRHRFRGRQGGKYHAIPEGWLKAHNRLDSPAQAAGTGPK